MFKKTILSALQVQSHFDLKYPGDPTRLGNPHLICLSTVKKIIHGTEHQPITLYHSFVAGLRILVQHSLAGQ